MKNLVEEFTIVRKNFIDLLNKFPQDKVEEKLFGKWNLKEVIAHFTAWDRYFIQAVKLLRQGVSMPYWESINSFNQNAVVRIKKADWPKVYGEFIKVGQVFIDEYKKISQELGNKLIWKNKKYTPREFLLINIDHYEKAQVKELQKLLKKWKIK